MKLLKQISSIFLALCMTLTLLPISVLAAETSSFSIKLSTDNVIVEGTATTLSWDKQPNAFRYYLTVLNMTTGVYYEGSSQNGKITYDNSYEFPTTLPVAVYEMYVQSVDENGTILGKSNTVSLTVKAKDATAGTCGDNLTWTLKNGVLTISGTGEMEDYWEDNRAPWLGDQETTNIKSVILENGVTSIGVGAFTWCSSLTSVTIPNSVTSIGEEAFISCTSLTSVTIPDSVATIGANAFCGCTSLTSITIPNSVTNIEFCAFYACEGLKRITIPDSVTVIDECAFYGCINLISVDIPNSVTDIGEGAFFGCNSLTDVTIPSSVTNIGDIAFSGCEKLTKIQVDSKNQNYASEDGVLYNKDKTILICYPVGKEDDSFVIPDSVTSIESWAFYGTRFLKNITVPHSMTSIGPQAFYYCDSLESIVIPDSVTSIENDAFDGCANLAIVTMPSSVTSVGNSAFLNCNSLTDIYYSGSEAEWNAISIESGNDCLTNATIHYNSSGDVVPSGDLVAQLNQLSAAGTTAEKISGVQAIGLDTLKEAIQDETQGDEVVSAIEALETSTNIKTEIKVTDQAPDAFTAGNIDVLGAALNIASVTEGETNTVTLTVDMAENTHTLDANQYENALSFSLHLDNVTAQLSVPVQITLPIPSSLSTTGLVLFHYKDDGTKETVSFTLDQAQKTITFVMTSFSDFQLANTKGVTVRGEVTSYDPTIPTTLTLLQDGEVKYTADIPAAASGTGQQTQAFSFDAVPAGTYTLTVAKPGHLTYTVTGVVVGAEELDLTAASGKAYQNITLLAGDMDGDGKINVSDLNLVWSADNYNKSKDDAKDKLSDVNGDGNVNVSDLNIVWSAANYNKGTADCTVSY